MANVTDDERLKLVHSAVGADFGLTIDQVVSHADDSGLAWRRPRENKSRFGSCSK